MKTHKKILSAVWSLADYEPTTIAIPFRGYDVVRMDACDIQAYKLGNCTPLIIKWEDLTPVEALRIKRACRYPLHSMQKEAEQQLTQVIGLRKTIESLPYGSYVFELRLSEAEIRLTQIMRLRETFEKSPFGF